MKQRLLRRSESLRGAPRQPLEQTLEGDPAAQRVKAAILGWAEDRINLVKSQANPLSTTGLEMRRISSQSVTLSVDWRALVDCIAHLFPQITGRLQPLRECLRQLLASCHLTETSRGRVPKPGTCPKRSIVSTSAASAKLAAACGPIAQPSDS